MKQMTLSNIAKAIGGEMHNCQESLEIQGVVTDSRQVEENFLFLAIKGERVDGHKFIPQVIEAGAAAVVCEVIPEGNVPYILVNDVLAALRDMAEFYRNTLDIPLIGITGSVGKTSTKECIASVLAQKYNVHKTEGNFNNEIGVPLTLLKIRDHHEVAVLEMGINHFGEMHRLSKMVKPDIVVMTNIGQCHLEFLGSRDGILQAKSEIFDYLQEDGTVILNGDDDKLSTIEHVNKKTPVMFGIGQKNALYADELTSKGLFGTQMKIHVSREAETEFPELYEEAFYADMPLPGEHMVYNALAATAVGLTLGLTTEEIAAGIEVVQPTGGRSNIIKCADKVLIDDCYNANPVSMCAAIDLLALADTRKVAILGDMYELGEDELRLHANVGRYAVEKGIDVLVCVGEMSKAMAEEALKVRDEAIKYYSSKQELFADIQNVIEAGDTILIKASHGMGFAEIVEKLK
ncbi:MAG: UDP-N-acetylmuramoyl-tripeptide--D-alanyl-D-alanine ligase [Lachnospiraceae bacterium]|nr:UDP-N-acetylmuramoyl-tripeptide--D-alanyl-D-alanine ligase [Lachnospiraceae bacterium]